MLSVISPANETGVAIERQYPQDRMTLLHLVKSMAGEKFEVGTSAIVFVENIIQLINTTPTVDPSRQGLGRLNVRN